MATPAAAHCVAVRRVRHDLPIDPARAVPPAVAEPAVRAEGQDIDAVRAAGRGRGLPDETSAERFPVMPARSVPVPVPEMAVVVDGEELALSAIPPRRDGRSRCERAAK